MPAELSPRVSYPKLSDVFLFSTDFIDVVIIIGNLSMQTFLRLVFLYLPALLFYLDFFYGVYLGATGQ